MEPGRIRGLVIDEIARVVTVNGAPIALTPSEYALLSALAARPRRAMTPRELLEAMWGVRWEVETTPLQVHVSRLRSTLGESAATPRHIITVYGFGYRFEPEPDVLTTAEVRQDQLATRHAADGAPGLVYALFSPDRICLWIGQHVERLLGWQLEDITGTSVYDRAHPDDRPGMLAMRAALDGGHPAAIVIRLRTASGGYRPVEALVRPVVGSDGRVHAFFVEWKPAPDTPSAPPSPLPMAERPPAAESGPRTVELAFDRELTLVSVSPREAFLGYESSEVIGSAFSPTGIGAPVLLGVVTALIAAGTLMIDGMVDMVTAAGQPIRIRVQQQLFVDEQQQFTEMRSVLHLPD